MPEETWKILRQTWEKVRRNGGKHVGNGWYEDFLATQSTLLKSFHIYTDKPRMSSDSRSFCPAHGSL